MLVAMLRREKFLSAINPKLEYDTPAGFLEEPAGVLRFILLSIVAYTFLQSRTPIPSLH